MDYRYHSLRNYDIVNVEYSFTRKSNIFQKLKFII